MSPPPRRRRKSAAAAAALLLTAAAAATLALLAATGGHPARPPAATTPPPATTTSPSTTNPSPTSTAPVEHVPPTPGPPAIPPPARPAFGVNVSRLFIDRTYSAAQIDAQLRAAQADGVTLARSDALWELSESNAPAAGLHHYDWTLDDATAAALAAHRIRWLPILDYAPQWATGAPTTHAPPRAADDFAAFAKAFAQRYGPGGGFWRVRPDLPSVPTDTYEVWNEPDSPGFWAPTPSPAGYIALYLSGRDAIKQADAGARVLVGGLTDPVGYLPELLAARPDAKGHLDGVAIHPYAPNPLAVLGRVRDARRVLDALRLPTVPLYLTEFGWATSPPGSGKFAAPQTRPGYISSTIEALARVDCKLGGVLLYAWVTPERDPANEEDWYGVEHPGATASASSRALTTALARAAAPDRLPALRLCPATAGA